MLFPKPAFVSDLCLVQSLAVCKRIKGMSPDRCEGIAWMRGLVDANSAMVIDDLRALVVANYGTDQTIKDAWFLDLLIDQHAELDADFRMALIERLSTRKSLDLICQPIAFTDAEKALLRDRCRERCALRPDLYAAGWARIE